MDSERSEDLERSKSGAFPKIKFREWPKFTDDEKSIAELLVEHYPDQLSGVNIRSAQCAKIQLIPKWGYQTLFRFNPDVEGYQYLLFTDKEGSDNYSENGVVRCGDDVFVENETDNSGRRLHSWIRLEEEGDLTFVHYIFDGQSYQEVFPS